MTQPQFYLKKAKNLCIFLWWRNWPLLRGEWSMTYAGYQEGCRWIREEGNYILQRMETAVRLEEGRN